MQNSEMAVSQLANLGPTLTPNLGKVGDKFDHSFFHHVWLHNMKLGGGLESKVKTKVGVQVVLLAFDLGPNLRKKAQLWTSNIRVFHSSPTCSPTLIPTLQSWKSEVGPFFLKLGPKSIGCFTVAQFAIQL